MPVRCIGQRCRLINGKRKLRLVSVMILQFYLHRSSIDTDQVQLKDASDPLEFAYLLHLGRDKRTSWKRECCMIIKTPSIGKLESWKKITGKRFQLNSAINGQSEADHMHFSLVIYPRQSRKWTQAISSDSYLLARKTDNCSELIVSCN